MAYTSSHVLIGNATLYIDDANIGWTKNGVSIEHESENYEVEADQQSSPIKTFRVKETYKIKTTIMELTLGNLRKAWGLTQEVDYSTYGGYAYLPFGGDAGDLTEHTLDVYGIAPGGASQIRRVHFYKVVAIEFGAYTFLKGEEAAIPVVFTAMVDTSKAEGQMMGYIKDELPTGTSTLRARVTVTS